MADLSRDGVLWQITGLLKRCSEHLVQLLKKVSCMDFEEFLWALGAEPVMKLIRRRFAEGKPMGQSDHRTAMELFRQYLVVGGMPQAVEAFANGRDIKAAESAKHLVLDLYRDDIGKFAGRLKHKVRAIWDSIPGALSAKEKRFRPGLVKEGVKMRELDSPFEWLAESMTVNISSNVTDPSAGLKLSEDRTSIKCYMGDTGLLVSHAFSENSNATYDMQWKVLTGKLEVNKGMLVENVVAQMLKAAGQSLFYHYNSDQSNASNRMEVDFLLAKSKVSARHNIRPVEVKSAGDYSTISLERFMKKFRQQAATPIILHTGAGDPGRDVALRVCWREGRLDRADGGVAAQLRIAERRGRSRRGGRGDQGQARPLGL